MKLQKCNRRCLKKNEFFQKREFKNLKNAKYPELQNEKTLIWIFTSDGYAKTGQNGKRLNALPDALEKVANASVGKKIGGLLTERF